MPEPQGVVWQPGNNGAGKRMWFLIASDESLPVEDRYHYGRDGRLVRYGSHQGALRAAGSLNRLATTRPGTRAPP